MRTTSNRFSKKNSLITNSLSRLSITILKKSFEIISIFIRATSTKEIIYSQSIEFNNKFNDMID